MKNKFKAFLAALSASIVTMCTPAPAMAEAVIPANSSVWIYVTQYQNNTGGVTTNLNTIWYLTEELCKEYGPKITGKPSSELSPASGCFEMKSIFQFVDETKLKNARKKQPSI